MCIKAAIFLLILDEATEGLAPRIAQDIWRIVRRVRESGMATVKGRV